MYGVPGNGCALGGESFHLLVPRLRRREPSENPQGRVVDPPGDLVELVLGQVVQARALGQVTADHAVAVLVAAPLVRAVRVRVIGRHARRLVDQQAERGLAAVVPCAAGPGRGRLIRIDQRGDQETGLAFDLRVDAPARDPAADHRVRLPVPAAARLHRGGPFVNRHARRDGDAPPAPPLARPPPAMAARQVGAQVARPVGRLPVHPRVQRLMAGPHQRVVGELQAQPAGHRGGRPAAPQRVHDPRDQPVA